MPPHYSSDRKPGHAISVQTGPWEGPGSWLYKVYCGPCKFRQIEDSHEAAWEVVEDHYRQEAVPREDDFELEDGEDWEEV